MRFHRRDGEDILESADGIVLPKIENVTLNILSRDAVLVNNILDESEIE